MIVKIEIECADEHSAHFLKKHLSANYTVKKFAVVPDTEELMKDAVFRELYYKALDAEVLKNEYIKYNNNSKP
jgi:DNA-binding transcriptional regulator LsrR (DeoR family)